MQHISWFWKWKIMVYQQSDGFGFLFRRIIISSGVLIIIVILSSYRLSRKYYIKKAQKCQSDCTKRKILTSSLFTLTYYFQKICTRQISEKWRVKSEKVKNPHTCVYGFFGAPPGTRVSPRTARSVIRGRKRPPEVCSVPLLLRVPK